MKNGNQGEGGGRPAVEFNQDQINLVEKLASVLSKAQLSDYFGISENTFRAVEERQPEVSEAYKRGKGRAIASVAGNLVNQAQNGNVTAAIFYLKTQAGWKEQDTTTISASSDNVIQIVRATKPD
jgi:hypothetical protein